MHWLNEMAQALIAAVRLLLGLGRREVLSPIGTLRVGLFRPRTRRARAALDAATAILRGG
jgi:predicted small integral membrane protein